MRLASLEELLLREDEALAAVVFWNWWEDLREEVDGAATCSMMSPSVILLFG